VSTDTSTTDPQSVVDEWNSTHGRGTLIRWRMAAGGNWRTGVAWTGAYLMGSAPTLRPLTGEFVTLDNVEVHPRAAELEALGKVDAPSLDFPPPTCGFCGTVDCQYDDGWTCPQCSARWPSNGYDGTRPCVECRDLEAAVIGEDGQPRCLPCQAMVADGEIDPTPPYDCRRCRQTVHGISPQTAGGTAFGKRLCGGCNAADESRADLDRYLNQHAGV
jgi:hypothetical protein